MGALNSDRSAGPGERDPWDRQLAVCSIAIAVLMGVMALVPGVFRPDRLTWALAAMAGMLALGIRHEISTVPRWEMRGHFAFLFFMVVLAGGAGRNLATVLGAVAAPGAIVMFAAVWFRRGEVFFLATVSVPVLCSVLYLQGYSGIAIGLVCVGVALVEVSPALVILAYRQALEEATARAQILAQVDQLTGLLNRRGMAQVTDDLLNRAQGSGSQVGVLVLDIDHFKQINDRHGHAMGDAVLQALAQILTSCSDPDDIVVRLGGEEFAVLRTVTDLLAFHMSAERLREQVAVAPMSIPVTVSVGGTWDAPTAAPGEVFAYELIRRADALLYEAKEAGRNTVRVRATQPASEQTGLSREAPPAPG